MGISCRVAHSPASVFGRLMVLTLRSNEITSGSPQVTPFHLAACRATCLKNGMRKAAAGLLAQCRTMAADWAAKNWTGMEDYHVVRLFNVPPACTPAIRVITPVRSFRVER